MTSSKAVVAKVIADLGLREDNIKITDISEYIGEAMEKIGASTQLDNKTDIIELKNYQAKLPCDLYRLNYVAYAAGFTGGWIPMKKSTGVFSVCDKVDCCKHPHMLIQDNVLIPLVKNLYNLVDDRKALDILNSDQNIRQTLSALLNQYTWDKHPYAYKGTNFSPTVQYDIKPGYLVSNIKDGWIKIRYQAIYMDEEGMPLIPDLPSYFEGLANVLLEAAATGRPIIASNIPGCKETIDDGENGYLVEVKSVDGLVEKIEKFLNLSFEEQREMGLKGRKKVEKEFDRNIVVNAYMEEINKCFQKKKL